MSSSTTAPEGLRRDGAIIGLVGVAHMISHYSQLLLPPLFPWLKEDFGVGYVQLGFLMTLFFVVSCGVQTLAGFLVDRHGPRSILFVGLSAIAIAAFGFASSTSYGMLAVFAVVAGIGNGVFHPADFTLLNRKVSGSRLGHAYSIHGVTGSLGWALAPAMLVPLTVAFSWRVALMAAGLLACSVLALLVIQRGHLAQVPARPAKSGGEAQEPSEGNFAFLRIPAVWMCFGFFFLYAVVISVVQDSFETALNSSTDVVYTYAADQAGRAG